MNKIATLLVLLVCTFITSCSDDDNATLVNATQQTTDGEWHLVQVTGSIAGVNHQFEPGTITWTFNDEDDTVAVVNTNTNEMVEDFFDSGTYEFSFLAVDQIPPTCGYYLIINNIDFGCMEFVGNDMILTQQVADGYTLKFTK